MEYRSLGRSGIRVSEIGLGAWAIGGDAWGPVEDEASVAALRRALELGTNFIDTADVYGDGHSEELVARFIKGRRDDAVLATKGGLMGHHRDPQEPAVYDRPAKVREALENSLRRLGTDYVDVYFDHIWWDSHEETEAFMEAHSAAQGRGQGQSSRAIHRRRSLHPALQQRRRSRRCAARLQHLEPARRARDPPSSGSV